MHSIATRQNSKPALTTLGTTEKCDFIPEEKASVLTRRGRKIFFYLVSSAG